MAAICRREISVRGKPTEVLSLGASLDDNPKKILLIIPDIIKDLQISRPAEPYRLTWSLDGVLDFHITDVFTVNPSVHNLLLKTIFLLSLGTGGWVYETHAIQKDSNPGVTAYYKVFMESIYSEVSDTHSVWVVSHAAHSHTSDLPFWPDGQHIYSLEDQIQHKMAFILDHVPKDAQITLIGHSIGSYIILNVIKGFEDNPEVNIDKSYLLFPTIERMKNTPNGRKLWPLFCYFRWLAAFLVIFAYMVPFAFKRMCFALYFRGKYVPRSCMEATAELLHPKIIQNVLWMAYHELAYLGGADIDTIEKHKDRLVFYYGATDGWCPKSYRSELMEKVDGLTSFLCEEGFPHAFVLGNAERMGKKVALWITS